MPRPRYPSDEERKKTRPHVKIHLSARSHPRYGAVFEDPESRGVIWGLWLIAVQYHAAQSGDEVALGQGELTWLTGRTQFRHALSALSTHCERMGYPVRVDGKRVVVQVRNLKRKQGFGSAERGATPRSSAPSDSDSDSEVPKYRIPSHCVAPATAESRPSGTPEGKGIRAAPRIREGWSKLRDTLGLYGKELREEPGRQRARAIRARLDAGASVDDLAHVVHGYAYYHARPADERFDPWPHFNPDTLLRASNFEKYLDAYREAMSNGKQPPFMREWIQ